MEYNLLFFSVGKKKSCFQDDDPEYYDRFIGMFSRPYELNYRPTTLKDLSETPAGSDDSYDEDVGDECFARIMGTYLEDGK